MYTAMSPLARTNLDQEKSLNEILGKKGVRWAKLIIKYSQLPGMIQEVYATGIEHLPDKNQPAPIMAFAHKKFFDIQAIAYFMAGRPIDSFHGVTIMSQAGIHSAIYPYSEIIPASWKNPITDPLARVTARSIGHIIKDLFTSINTYPVYRETLDVPATKEQYESKEFGGKKILGMEYEQYKTFAASQTRQTLMKVFRDIGDANRGFIIAPEGTYCHDGKVQKLEEFIGFAAHRKKRNTIATGVSYDELCLDNLGRITCYLGVSKQIEAPSSKEEIPSWLKNLQQSFLDGQTIVASHIIALSLKELTKSRSFRESELLDLYFHNIEIVKKIPDILIAPNLHSKSDCEMLVGSFFKKKGKKWLKKKKELYHFNFENINKFAPLERTVNSLEWNYNQIQHLQHHFKK